MPSQGLLRLELQVNIEKNGEQFQFRFLFKRNNFNTSENEIHERLQNLLAKRRETIFKSKENAEESTTGGRDTVGTARSRTG